MELQWKNQSSYTTIPSPVRRPWPIRQEKARKKGKGNEGTNRTFEETGAQEKPLRMQQTGNAEASPWKSEWNWFLLVAHCSCSSWMVSGRRSFFIASPSAPPGSPRLSQVRQSQQRLCSPWLPRPVLSRTTNSLSSHWLQKVVSRVHLLIWHCTTS